MTMKKNSLLLLLLLLWLVIALSAMAPSSATMIDDEKDCADQMTSLASCIPFVSGSAKKPTPQCCQDTQKVKATKPKCLCVLIKESSDPAIGLPINTTLALQMPSACNIDAKVSNCPTLLKLSPDSPDAKIFKDADQGSSTSAATANTASTTPSGSDSDSNKATTTTSSNKGGKLEMFLGGNLVVVLASIACIYY